jgi:NHL repeat
VSSWGFHRHAFTVCVASALAGCGGSQPLGVPGATPQSRAVVAHTERGGSRMLPGSSNSDLLYVSDAGTNAVYVFSYPWGRYLASLGGLTGRPHGVCADRAGNVFVTEFTSGNGQVQEYAHGAMMPIADLGAPGEPEECSVDPTTGNLAVAISRYYSNPSGVAIYTNAQGVPMFLPSIIGMVTAASYDNNGNLFIAGNDSGAFTLAELPAGGGKFIAIKVKAEINGNFFEPIFWDGHHLAIGNLVEYAKEYFIDRVRISGQVAKVVGITSISLHGSNFSGDTSFFIRGDRIAVNFQSQSLYGRVAFWAYPRGGTHTHATRRFGSKFTDGVTVSLAPSR